MARRRSRWKLELAAAEPAPQRGAQARREVVDDLLVLGDAAPR
ncbi:MAG: hypothetical protein WKG00_31660 [Polyangiaceae bacterium]